MLLRLLRWMLWVPRGLLLVIALLALFAWPWSWWHMGAVGGTRWRLEQDRVDRRDVACGWKNGRIVVGWWWWTFSGWLLDEGRRQAGSPPPGWTFDRMPGSWWWMDPPAGSGWGPFRRNNYGSTRSGITDGRRVLSFPAWLLALAAGCWPATSIALLIRRRLRRMASPGHCRKCGYDLRATPAASGPMLPICPECGEKTDRREMRADARGSV